MEKKQIYCFLGLPASGKGTQAELFAKTRDYEQIGIGDITRDAILNNPDLNLRKRFKDRYDAGQLQPDEEIYPLLEKRIEEVKTSGIVFDNFPFNKGQLNFLLEFTKNKEWEAPIIIYIVLDPESAIKRISSRRVCPSCKAIYPSGEICIKCGSPLITRTDDNENTARTRIMNYLPNINDVVSSYKKVGKVIEIDGEPSIEEVTKEIDKQCKTL